MPILYLVTRGPHDADESSDIHEWHWWERTKAAALKYAKRESGDWGVWADVHRINIPATKRGLFMVARLDNPEGFVRFMGHDRVRRVAQFHGGTRLDRKVKTSDLERAVEQARALLREEGGA